LPVSSFSRGHFNAHAATVASVEATTVDSVRLATIEEALRTRRLVFQNALEDLLADPDPILAAASALVDALAAGRKVLSAGNGGSAAQAQHFSAELVGRFKRERSACAVLSLTADSSVLTALANDYGYNEVFARQVEALGTEGDIFVAFSTSGRSQNLLRAAEVARRRGLTVIALTGSRNNPLQSSADIRLVIPVADTDTIQELQTVMTHVLCDVIERELPALGRESAS
jgi:D-sedoheptulose 7-phosphate isomerase